MVKETYYFSHDFKARHDKKIAALITDFKAAGYGLYWCVVEMIHEDGGGLEMDEMTVASIAKDMNESAETVALFLDKCVHKYRLFWKSSDHLSSPRATRNLDKRKEISVVRSTSGKKGAIAKQMLSKSSANGKHLPSKS